MFPCPNGLHLLLLYYCLQRVFCQRFVTIIKPLQGLALVSLSLCFNKCAIMLRSRQQASSKSCGLNFHRLGLPLIFICAYPQPQRVRFTDCGGKVFPVLGSATSTEVLQCLMHPARWCIPVHYYINNSVWRFLIEKKWLSWHSLVVCFGYIGLLSQ